MRPEESVPDVRLPSFDIQLALAQTLTWHRYRRRLDKRMPEQPGSVYFKAVCEHTTRLQRFSEGFVAFSTSGVQYEILWLNRLVWEVFASQCLLQYGHVQHPEGRAMTKDEKAQCYYNHSKFMQLEKLRKHVNWKGHTRSMGEQEAKIAELEQELAEVPSKYQSERAWHGRDLTSAVENGEKALKRAFGSTGLDTFVDQFAVYKDFMNTGIHGHPFAAGFFYQDVGPGSTSLQDDRSPHDPPEWALAVVLASKSVEMLADECGERPLIEPMLRSAMTDLENHRSRFVGHFPTVSIGLE